MLDLKTRRVMGWSLGLQHNSDLTLAALQDALAKHPAPTILHSDQGSENLSQGHQDICRDHGITLSCSKPASPWQNAFMERFFGSFKRDLGPLSRFADDPHLFEGIAGTMYYYNTRRIHSALGMPPAKYVELIAVAVDTVSKKQVPCHHCTTLCGLETSRYSDR